MTRRSPTQWPAILVARARNASWPRRVFAALVFVAAALLASWVLNLPAATTVEDAVPKGSRGWPVEVGDEVSLVSPKPGEVLDFHGPNGRGVTVQADAARLTASTLQGLQARGVPLSAQPAALLWVTHDGGQSAATVRVGFQPTGPHPALTVGFTGQGSVAALTFRGQDARLSLYMAGAAVDQPSPDVEVNDGAQAFAVEGSGAFPLEAEIEPGEAFTLQLAQSAASGATFAWGPQPNHVQPLRFLRIDALKVRRPDESDRLYACGAAAHAISWLERNIGRIPCRSSLKLRGLDLNVDGGVLRVIGNGFLRQGGDTTVQVWKAATASPPIAALLAAAYSGLATWVIAAVLGPSIPVPTSGKARPKPSGGRDRKRA